MTVEEITVTGRRVTVDLLVWRRYRRRTPGLVEQVLGLNPALADAPFIPPGSVVRLPVLTDTALAAPERQVVELWSPR